MQIGFPMQKLILGARGWLIWALFLGMSWPSLAQPPAPYKIHKRKRYTMADSLRGALRPERTCYDVHYYNLSVEFLLKKKQLRGHNEIHFVVKETTQKIQIDLFANLHIDKIVMGGQPLAYERRHHAVFVHFPAPLPAGSRHHIQVWYGGKPLVPEQAGGRHGFYWTTDRQGRPWVGVSCEHLGASFWFPNKDHLADEPDSMRLHYTYPADLECIANGRLEKVDTVGQGLKTSHWFTKYPINNYNVTVYLGHYASLTLPYVTKTHQREIVAYFLDGEREKAGVYFAKTAKIVQLFEELFGEYPFWGDKMAIVQSPYPGMEHQTCVAIGPGLDINDEENWAYHHQVPWAGVLPHELAHEWWGNAVSVGDMADVWLHEGFATYAELLLVETALGHDAYLREVQKQETFIQYLYPILGNAHVNDDTFSTNDIYHRGAVVLHELRTQVGDIRVFLGILRRFYLESRFRPVTTQDFIRTVNEMTQQDYTQFLHERLYTKRR
jgi:aminopeptidase N